MSSAVIYGFQITGIICLGLLVSSIAILVVMAVLSAIADKMLSSAEGEHDNEQTRTPYKD